jgi:D-alanine transaminase
MSDAALKTVIRRNGVRDGIAYPQITRGIAPRDHAFPRSVNPVLVVTSR